MRTLTMAAAVAALAWPLPAIPGAAQEATMAEALAALERKHDTDRDWRLPRPYRPALAILRQASGPRPSAELDAFADRVAAIMADATLPEHVRRNATDVLMGAADTDGTASTGEGTPYPRAFDLLVQVYEGGTYDGALSAIWLADSVRGPAYVRGVFERSERPPLCHRGGGYEPAQLSGATNQGIPVLVPLPTPPECEGYSFRLDARPTPWCRAGSYLFRGIVAEAWERTPGERRGTGYGPPDGLPEHVADWHRRCAW